MIFLCFVALVIQIFFSVRVTDVTAKSKEVKGQSACFIHHCIAGSAPDRSQLSDVSRYQTKYDPNSNEHTFEASDTGYQITVILYSQMLM